MINLALLVITKSIIVRFLALWLVSSSLIMMWEAQSSSRSVSIQLQNSSMKFHLYDHPGPLPSHLHHAVPGVERAWPNPWDYQLPGKILDLWPQLHFCIIFPHVLNLLMIGVDRLLQHALHSPPSQGGELQPNYVDHVPHHSSYHLVHSVVPFEVTMILTGSRICLRLVGDCLS